jgi:hypothetical protein
MTRAALTTDTATRMPTYEKLETLILAIQRDSHTNGRIGWGYRTASEICVIVDESTYHATTTRTGWRIEAPDCIGAAPDLLDACRLATMGR